MKERFIAAAMVGALAMSGCSLEVKSTPDSVTSDEKPNFELIGEREINSHISEIILSDKNGNTLTCIEDFLNGVSVDCNWEEYNLEVAESTNTN